MIAYGYDRVSTLKQVENSSLKIQRQAIERHCELRGWKLKRIFTDPGKSGKNVARPGLQAAIEAASKAKGVIVFYDLSRFSRSIQDLLQIAETLKACGAGVSSCTEAIDTTDTSPSSELTFHVLAACAQFQRRLIGFKVKEANARKVGELGYRTQGKQPVGWKVVNGVRVPCERERAIVARAVELYGSLGPAGAARALQASGEPTIMQLRGGRDGEWTARKVLHLLTKAPAGNGGC